MFFFFEVLEREIKEEDNIVIFGLKKSKFGDIYVYLWYDHGEWRLFFVF